MLLGFKQRFADKILDGSKVFTMRKERKIQPKIGETLHMYTALRTKHTKVITKTHKLVSTQIVEVNIADSPKQLQVKIQVDGRVLGQLETEMFVICDGFNDVPDFARYWIEDSTGKKYKPTLSYKVTASVTLYHWTALKF